MHMFVQAMFAVKTHFGGVFVGQSTREVSPEGTDICLFWA